MQREEKKYPWVEVHFKDSKGQERVVVIDAANDDRVKAIFLHGAEQDFVVREKRRDGKRGQSFKTPEETWSVPDGVTLLPDNGSNEGPRGVCYYEGGQYKCWGPS